MINPMPIGIWNISAPRLGGTYRAIAAIGTRICDTIVRLRDAGINRISGIFGRVES
jgi:hypothetical protein